jgi:hypothetical protein
MNSELSGQANFVVNPDYLKDQGFINIQDYQGAYQ